MTSSTNAIPTHPRATMTDRPCCGPEAVMAPDVWQIPPNSHPLTAATKYWKRGAIPDLGKLFLSRRPMAAPVPGRGLTLAMARAIPVGTPPALASLSPPSINEHRIHESCPLLAPPASFPRREAGPLPASYGGRWGEVEEQHSWWLRVAICGPCCSRESVHGACGGAQPQSNGREVRHAKHVELFAVCVVAAC
jgi:hypothetical protein